MGSWQSGGSGLRELWEDVGLWAGWGPRRWALQVGAAHYQAIGVLGLQVDGTHHIHPHHALLRKVRSLWPNQELPGWPGGFWILGEGVDAEQTLCVCWRGEVLAAQPGSTGLALQSPPGGTPGRSSAESGVSGWQAEAVRPGRGVQAKTIFRDHHVRRGKELEFLLVGTLIPPPPTHQV